MRITSPENPTIPDPHVWFSIPLWRIIARGITEQLVHYDNTHQAVYRHLGTQFDLSLQQLDTQIRTTLAVLPPENRILVTAHDAFHYFGREYGFIVVALQGISTETESGIYDVHELVTYIVDHKIPAIFVESSIPEKNLYAVQEACAARVWQIRIGAPLYSDALGPLGSNADTYEGMMTHNLRSLMQSLQTEK
jgi:manganese/zinc/iron transport system substrate-binding protein